MLKVFTHIDNSILDDMFDYGYLMDTQMGRDRLGFRTKNLIQDIGPNLFSASWNQSITTQVLLIANEDFIDKALKKVTNIITVQYELKKCTLTDYERFTDEK